MPEHTWWETIEAETGHLIKTIEKLIAEGNVRRIRITHKDQTIAEFPLTIGAVGLVLAPVFAAVGAIAAIVTDCKIHVERVDKTPH